MIIINSRYALVGYFITSYPTRAHGIIVVWPVGKISLKYSNNNQTALSNNKLDVTTLLAVMQLYVTLHQHAEYA